MYMHVMNGHMYTYMYMYRYMYMCMYMCTYMYTCMYLYIQITAACSHSIHGNSRLSLT